MPSSPFSRDRGPDDVVLSSMDRRIERKWLTPGRVLKVLLVLVVPLSVAYAYFNYGNVRAVTVDGERLTISTVNDAVFSEFIPLTGYVEPLTIVYLEAVEGGQVTGVLAEEGAFVEAGESLVILKNTNLQLELMGREAQLTEQINNLNNTRLSFEQNRLKHKRDLIDVEAKIATYASQIERREKLVNAGVTTVEQLEDMTIEMTRLQRLREAIVDAQQVDTEFQASQMDQLNDAIVRMNQNLGIARENLDSLTVRAPITGQLTALEANVGESKAKGQRIGQVDQVDAYKVTAYVDEFYLSRIKVGQRATVEINGRQLLLEVNKIYPQISNRQFDIDLEFLTEAPGTVRRGQSLQLRLEIGGASRNLVLANGPYIDETGGTWAFVVSPSGGYAERRPIKTGRRNLESVEITGGLQAGDRVITSSYSPYLEYEVVNIR